VKVIIPLAGKGTRLRPHTYVTPKPLLRVGGRPVMSYIMDDLQALGVEEIVFITGYLGETIEAYVRREYPRIQSRFVVQEVQNGTAGAVQLAAPHVDDEVLIIFVDTLFDADLTLVRRLEDGEAGIIWAKEVEDYQRFGVIVTDERGYMKRIVEKPSDPISRLANIGLYYIRDWELLFEGIEHVMEGPAGKGGEYYLTDAFQYMIDRGARIRTVEVEGWYDCGQLETLLETNRHLLETGRSLRPTGGHNVRIHDPVRVAEGVRLENTTIGPNVTIGADCVVRDSTLREAIIGERTVLEGVRLRDSMIGNDVVLRSVDGRASVCDHTEITRD
jgi:glucose-1-phosphate thymidylyltransferase